MSLLKYEPVKFTQESSINFEYDLKFHCCTAYTLITVIVFVWLDHMSSFCSYRSIMLISGWIPSPFPKWQTLKPVNRIGRTKILISFAYSYIFAMWFLNVTEYTHLVLKKYRRIYKKTCALYTKYDIYSINPQIFFLACALTLLAFD